MTSAATLQRIDQGLSAAQREALALRGDGLIVAGAGAGKTTTLTSVVARDLLVDDVPVDRVLVCTFTRSAAANLAARTAARVADLTGGDAPDLSAMWVGTIDAICARLLREHALDAGLPPRFQIGDERGLLPLKQQALDHALTSVEVSDLHLIGELVDPAGAAFAAELDRLYDRLRAGEHDPAAVTVPSPRDVTADATTLARDIAALAGYVAKNHAAKCEEIADALLAGRVEDLPEDLKLGRPLKSAPEDIPELVADCAGRLSEVRLALIDARTAPYKQAAARMVAAYASRYDELKRDAELLDFADLTLHARRLLADDASAARSFDRVYVDEAQDTNPQQLAILRGLVSADGYMVAVGDSAQSIYSFRRADVEGFREQSRLVGGNLVALNENYRSQPPVLHAINAICARIDGLRDDVVTMQAKAPAHPVADGPAVELLSMVGEENIPVRQEADAAVPEILAARDRYRLRNQDVCVLCEANADAAVYAEALRAAGVPTLLIQKKGLMQREECLDVLAYLRLLASPDDEEALLRVLSSPFVGLPDLRLHKIAAQRSDLLAAARAANPSDPDVTVSLWEVLRDAEPGFCEHFDTIAAMMRERRVAELARLAVETHGFDLALALADPTGAMWRNVEKLITVIGALEGGHEGPSLAAVVTRLEAEREAGIDDGQDARLPADLDAVRVMTIHNAKGDEFPLTVVGRLSKIQRSGFGQTFWATDDGQIGVSLGAGMLDTAAATERDRSNAVRDAEKRRLAYVALTRAQTHLTLVAAAKLKRDGAASWQGTAKWLIGEGLDDPGHPEVGERRVVELTGAHDPAQVLLRGLDPEFEPAAATAGAVALSGSAGAIDAQLRWEPYRLASGPLSYAALTRWQRCGLRRHLEQDLGLAAPPQQTLDGGGAPAELADAGPVDLAAVFDEVEFGPDVLVRGGRAFGLRVHEALAVVDWQTDIDWRPTLEAHGLINAEREQAFDLVERIEASEIRQRLRRARRVQSELPFTTSAGDLVMQGFLDVIADEDDGAALVVDWKTGHDEEDVFAADYALQRKMYALAALRSPRRPAQVEAVTLHAATGQVDTDVFAQADIERLEADLHQAAAAVFAAAAEPAAATQQPFCSGCPGLRRGCPVAQAST